MSRSDRREPITDPQTRLAFGKYSGQSIAEILKEDPQYLVWLHENVERFELSAELLDEAEGSREEDYLGFYGTAVLNGEKSF